MWISNPRMSGGGDAVWRRRRRSAWLGIGRVWLYQDGRRRKDMGLRMAGGIIEFERYGVAVGKEESKVAATEELNEGKRRASG